MIRLVDLVSAESKSDLNFDYFKFLIDTLPYRQALREISHILNVMAHNHHAGMPDTIFTRHGIRQKRRAYAREINARGLFVRPIRHIKLVIRTDQNDT